MPASFEAAQQELERLVAELEAGQLPLDTLLSAYQRGAVLLQFCRERLNAVEQQVSVLDKGLLSAWKPE
jgi:exodeoxyribonuclease VII small subunit